jgi:hypothetical protein
MLIVLVTLFVMFDLVNDSQFINLVLYTIQDIIGE